LIASAVLSANVVLAEEGMPCKVTYLGKELILDPPARKVGDECFLPAKHATALGWDAKALNARALVSAHDKDANVFIRKVEGQDCIPLRATAQLLGGLTYWKDGGTRLAIYARLEWVGAANGSLSIKTSFPVNPRTSKLGTPDRVVVDLPYTVYTPGVPPVTKGLEKGVRLAEFNHETLRLVCTLGAKPALGEMKTVTQRQYEWVWTGADLVAKGPTGFVVAAAPAQAKAPTVPNGQPINLGQPTLAKLTETSYLLRVPVDKLPFGKTKVTRSDEGVTVEIPNANATEASEDVADGGFLSRFALASQTVGKTARAILTFAVTGAVGVNISPSARELLITLNRPKSAVGKISEKIIVIDPGHGGSDPGAHYGTGEDQVQEKTVNLQLATKLGELLSKDGAVVIMTRSDDSYPTLPQRAEAANQAEADFFISVHHNSNRMADSRSGTYTYYHSGDSEGELLADCIQSEMCKANGLPNRGVLADTTRFASGMAVLRKTNMPGVLLEIGYLNHATDRGKITDEEWQETVAQAIADGIRRYLGDPREKK